MTFIPLDANLRPFGRPPSMGRRENTASRAPHEDGLRYENAASSHSSFRAKARNLFRSRSAKRGGDDGSRETPCTLRRGMPIRERTVSHSFSSRLGSEPPLLRGTSFQGKEGVCRLPHRHSRLLTASFLWMSQAGIIAASVPTTVIKGMIRSPRGSGAVSITTAA